MLRSLVGSEMCIRDRTRSVEEARPKWLPRQGPSQLDIKATEWGITVRQIKKILAAVRSSTLYCHLKERHGFVNLYMVNDHFIIPWTANLGCSLALLLNPEGLEPVAMASHAWGEDDQELESALDSLCGDDLDLPIWLCTFSQYQPKKTDQVDDIGPTVAAVSYTHLTLPTKRIV
eukprot:TRINITY_DN51039_c0_g1_i1.p1 TRINITY_DN51039_c0_g1~~TRINITY_DN51039_c0_g1_i1.p1  ORF type:complete len:175 (+),score=46.10 TRINITY_DN51039_c0_g1_i1:47-571(+)